MLFSENRIGMLYGITLVFVAVQSLNNRMKGSIYKCLFSFHDFISTSCYVCVRFSLDFYFCLTVGAIYSFYKTKTKGGFLLKTLFVYMPVWNVDI